MDNFPKFKWENSKLSILPETWHTWYLGGADSKSTLWNSDPKIYFWANLGQISESCPFCLKTGTHSISRMIILIPTLVFWISNPKSIFGQIWAKKVKVVCFAWKRIHTVWWRCWSLTLLQFGALCTLCCIYVLWACNIIEKSPSYLFCLRIGKVSRGCWFLFQH